MALAEIRTNPSAVDVAPDLVSIITQTVRQYHHHNQMSTCNASAGGAEAALCWVTSVPCPEGIAGHVEQQLVVFRTICE